MPSEDELPFEDSLGTELRRTGETFELSGRTALVDGALKQGRRTVRRRRVAAVAGSVLTLALVGGGITFATGQLGTSGDGVNVASSGPVGQTATPTAETATDAATPTPSATPEEAATVAPSPSDAPTDGATATATPTAGTGTGEPSPDPTSRGTHDAGEPAPPLDHTLLMPTFRALLPEGLTVTDVTDSGGEFASVVVNDGKGRSLVQINVQQDMRDVAHQLYGDATTLPDGTLLATSKKPGEKGGAGVVMWTADSMRPDGMRVVVSAFNSGEQSSAATRKAPALTMDQLTALVISPEWPKLQQR
ncbi:hypothetical protein AB0H24_23860 [Streptomyces globisporus]|uniref:Uncharacterized protein n=2 Tax=Streptomyces globisporus TaxID=1908 RepID=A0ABM9H4K0_STRGL|nr:MULTISPECIES: hypothetical protein [Streptomyces]RDL10436.1 hypothetical protein DER30_3934 [Streptomyces sp. HB202]UIZ13730.1 hypothetical protein LZ559_15590 [Streptomyces sp. R527F]WSQ93289.1 hypothetical protein OG425_18785 [Streptomyces globisporus]WSV91255.1 hypothetical protein OG449_19025 [Streptomyces globisporus]CAH9418571.1 hypothetical protein SGL43_05620 [Streptomyces globisporus]